MTWKALPPLLMTCLVIRGKTQQEHCRKLKDVLKKLGGVEATLFQFLENILKKEVKCARYIVN